MNFLIPAGHEKTTGAVSGNLIEEALTEQLAEKIVKVLKEQGHKAVEPDFNLFDEVSKTNFATYIKDFDYVLEVHFNSYNGAATGTEIFVADGITNIGVEKAIMKRMSKWFKLRDADGVKTAKFKTLMAMKGKVDAALLEVSFIDSKTDMAIYLKNIDAIAKDIAYGVLEGFGIPIKVIVPPAPVIPKQDPSNGPYTTPEGQKLWFRAIEGSYETRQPAQAAVDRMVKDGKEAWLQALYLPVKK